MYEAMDDGETAAATEMAPYLPPELVWEIMALLPVKSLLRFMCVSKAWRHRISDDADFHGANLGVQAPCLLAYAWSPKEDKVNEVATISLYAWGESGVNLEDTMELPLDEDEAQCFQSCDGLVLMPTETVVRVLNPATRRVLTLPGSPNRVEPTLRFYELLNHQLFGIGHDPCSNTYKVARFFFGSMDSTGGLRHNFGMEVFTIGVDQHWRETTVLPPYPHIMGNTTYFKGSLFWTIDDNKFNEEESVPAGFLRFRLEDESFSVMQPPPRCRGPIHEMSYVAVLRGELGVAHPGPKYETIEIWMCNDVDANPPQWNQRYSFNVFIITPPDQYFEDIMYAQGKYLMLRQVFKDVVDVNDNDRVMDHPLESIVFYIPSLVSL